MLIRLFGILLAFVLVASPAAITAHTQPEAVYRVAAKIFAAGQLVGQPEFTVVAGSEVALGVSDSRGYGLRLTVDRDRSRPNVANAVALSSKLYFVDGSQWVLVGQPEVQTITGAAARVASSAPTVYGAGGYTVEYTITQTDRLLTPSEFSSVEDCPVWKELSANDGPLKGVRLRGDLVRTQLGDADYPYCCTSGNMRCCSTVQGTCCRDGVTGNNCCT